MIPLVLALPLALAAGMAQGSEPARDRVAIGAFAIDETEVTIAAFERFLGRDGRRTAAERAGGGHEFAGGWVRRPGWTFRAPSGRAGAPDEPAVHVSWSEASEYCAARGGRLPTAAEWREAAYTERRETPTDGFETGRSYAYPVGDRAEGMNVAGSDRWNRHAPVRSTARGINGLYDMGGNVWEWLADRRGGEALTAGGSWWYGAANTMAGAMQWKDASFYAVYIGFRCAYDLPG